ncbi:MAG TPA: alpha-galactosidase, partial [Actinobacteria bacterium]|nr:alpha-galactosidase [Actinomycetota bacterium]
VAAPDGTVVTFDVRGVPDGWTAELRGGGFVVERIMVAEELDRGLDLVVEVPEAAAEGRYELTVVAEGAGGAATLPFVVEVSPVVGGGVSLETEFPALRGPADVTFSFSLELRNDTAQEIQFGLRTEGPPGWQIEARPAGQSRASTVIVDAGATERITVDVDPPDFVPAGLYPVLLEASGQGESARAELAVEITGTYAMTLTTPDQRLNVEARAGEPSELALVVVNDGSAPLLDVDLSATPPRGWEVTFAPERIDRIEPGETAEVVATVTPAEDAITGDYRITLRARTAETSDQIEVRATVETSAVWGLVGVGVILVALAGLGAVFRRYGRR